jgi:hypothetical protein
VIDFDLHIISPERYGGYAHFRLKNFEWWADLTREHPDGVLRMGNFQLSGRDFID